MAGSVFRPECHAEVLRRVFDLSARGMPRALAESVLLLEFPEEDAAGIEELSIPANEGALTSDESAELETYVNIGELLAYWQSKARQVLHDSE